MKSIFVIVLLVVVAQVLAACEDEWKSAVGKLESTAGIRASHGLAPSPARSAEEALSVHVGFSGLRKRVEFFFHTIQRLLSGYTKDGGAQAVDQKRLRSLTRTESYLAISELMESVQRTKPYMSLRRIVVSLLFGYATALKQRPLLTNGVTGATMAFFGDIICQKGLEKQELMNWRRNAALMIYGLFYNGIVFYYLSRLYLMVLPQSVKEKPMRRGICCALLANFITSPCLSIPTFYFIIGVLEGLNINEALARLKGKFWTSFMSGRSVWLPVAFLNYGYVPAHFRNIVMEVANILWNIVIDYIAHSAINTTSSTGAAPQQHHGL
eukprot:gnl/MRDRNA2_/MRDRNA2_71796_c0_seq1.p1 gnl/MRDRNA2_/MRDRNA2_71796_c0~~gnl/MRDRNA2_/MRDRNA2_71796_c0_seq1.p1  ORF type:complete len:325 (-),score=36.87 gnl/MRDRNA2_/MRDRNA2_71796_c0_seq1:56-1030(-)